LKKIEKENYKNNFNSNKYEVYTAVARCFSNILDAMVLENLNLSSDKIGRPPFWYNEADLDFCRQSPTCAVSCVYFNHIICTLDIDVFNLQIILG
jgi:hypothetical protein